MSVIGRSRRSLSLLSSALRAGLQLLSLLSPPTSSWEAVHALTAWPRRLPASGLTVHSVLGGRFKKEIVVDGQSYLLLIRDEGGPPELQVRLPPRSGPLHVWGEGCGVHPWSGEAGHCARFPLVCRLGGRGGVCVQPGG